MARLLVCAFATVALFAASATALVGSHHMGNSVSQDRDEYLMCGKCTWDPKSGQSSAGTSATDVQGYYKLECPDNANSANTTQWGTLKYNCGQGCITCVSSTDIVIGKKIEGSYKKDAIVFPMVAASVQCCPEIVERTYWSQDGCVGTSKSEYQPAGCRWDDIFDNFDQYTCGSDGEAPEHWKSGCTAGTLNHGDDCPADPSCLTEYEPANRPCVKVGFAGQTTPAGYDKQTLTCHKDGNQKCIRAVRETYYSSSMTPADDGTLATLTCTDLYNGVGDFRQTAVTVLLAVAGFVAMLA